MVLGIDASRYNHRQGTGVEWYSYHLLNELLPLLGREHNTEVRLYMPELFDFMTNVPFNVKKRVIRAKRFWTMLRLSWELLRNKTDILFVPSHTLPFFFPRKTVITIHDVAFKKFPGLYSGMQRFILDSCAKKSAKKAWKIIVPSEATKLDMIKYYNCPEEKICVIPHGAPSVPKMLRWSEADTIKYYKHFRIEPKTKYFLFVGRLETKKNLERVVRAFGDFSKEFDDWKLILAGKRGFGFEKIWAEVEKLGLTDKVLMPGYITEDEKWFLLQNCRVFVFTTLYEGFGLPLLEAFSFGKPVLSSDCSAMPEVAGGGAYLVNPLKVDEITTGMKKLAVDHLLNNQLVKAGKEHLKNYSWEKAARETFEVLTS